MQEPKWVNAMEVELSSVEKNERWELVSLPYGKKPIVLKWVYKVKVNLSDEVIKYKARLVVKDFL